MLVHYSPSSIGEGEHSFICLFQEHLVSSVHELDLLLIEVPGLLIDQGKDSALLRLPI